MEPLDYAPPEKPVRPSRGRVTSAMFVAALVSAPLAFFTLILAGHGGGGPIPFMLVTGPIGLFLLAIAKSGSSGGNVSLIVMVIFGTPVLYAVYAAIIASAGRRWSRVLLIIAACHVACAAVAFAALR